jgi:hypothetical protein
MPHGSFADSAPQLAEATHAGESAHTHPGSSGCPDRSADTGSPARHSARSYRADTWSVLPSSRPPRPTLDNAAQSRHKGKARPLTSARALEGPGFCLGMCPGLRLCGVRAEHNARTPGRPEHPIRPDGRLSLTVPDRPDQRRSSTRGCALPRSPASIHLNASLQGHSALIPGIAQVEVPVDTPRKTENAGRGGPAPPCH